MDVEFTHKLIKLSSFLSAVASNKKLWCTAIKIAEGNLILTC